MVIAVAGTPAAVSASEIRRARATPRRKAAASGAETCPPNPPTRMVAAPRARAKAFSASCASGFKMAESGGNASRIGGPSGSSCTAGWNGGGRTGVAAGGRPCQSTPGTSGSGGGALGRLRPPNAMLDAGSGVLAGNSGAALASASCCCTASAWAGVSAMGAGGTDARLG